jgi:pimeloyl-ACP methyl ester carboxylesterase
MPHVRTTDGTDLFTSAFGEGAPMVFAHSWGFSGEMWNYQVPVLAELGARVVTYDRRGHGRSDRPGAGYDLDTLADDLAAVVRSVGTEPVTLVGHSLGCSEIVRMLTRHPDVAVARVALVSPILPFLVRTPDNAHGLEPELLAARADALRADVPRWCTDNAPGFFGEATVCDGLESWLIRMIVDTPLSVLLATMSGMAEDLRGEVAALELPTLVVHGDLDASAPIASTGERVAELAPQARLEVYEGAGHGLFASHHARLDADLAAFAGLAGSPRPQPVAVSGRACR